MKMKHHAVPILQNKLLKNMLIYYYYRILKIPHYVLIKDFNRIMANKTKHHGKKSFCRFCCQCFSSSRVLECYVKKFLASNHTKSDLLAAKVVYVNFWNFKRLTKAPFVIYGNFECVLILSADNSILVQALRNITTILFAVMTTK